MGKSVKIDEKRLIDIITENDFVNQGDVVKAYNDSCDENDDRVSQATISRFFSEKGIEKNENGVYVLSDDIWYENDGNELVKLFKKTTYVSARLITSDEFKVGIIKTKYKQNVFLASELLERFGERVVSVFPVNDDDVILFYNTEKALEVESIISQVHAKRKSDVKKRKKK